jgi:hypothetical protein
MIRGRDLIGNRRPHKAAANQDDRPRQFLGSNDSSAATTALGSGRLVPLQRLVLRGLEP